MRFLFMLAAGLLGAGGVASAAAATHGGGAYLTTISSMALAHAPAFLALALSRLAGTPPRLLDYAGLILLAGVVFFCGDLAAREFLGSRLFPYAAPTGGTLMIVGWLAVAASAFSARAKA